MLPGSVTLYCVVALGIAVLAGKYGLGAVPTTYHAGILAASEEVPGDAQRRVLRTVYRILGGALLACALGMAALALGPLAAGQGWARAVLPAMALALGLPATVMPLGDERATGVRTPWRASAGLLALAGVATVLSLL